MLIKTQQPYFFDYIRWRVKNSKNFLCSTIGQTGSGKSYANLKGMELLNPQKKPEEIVKNMCLTGLEFMDRLNSGQLDKGDGLTLDEVGLSLSAKDWQSMSNRLINQVLQTFRHLNLIVFFNTPSFSFIDASSRRLFHSLWETMSIDFKTNVCEIKPLLVQTNARTGVQYFKYLRVNDKQHGLLPLKRIYLKLPSKKLTDLYEIKKDKFTKQLNKRIYAELQEIENKSLNKKPLTEHQQNIYNMIKDGMKYEAIANKLGVSKQAVKGTVGLIRKKVTIEPKNRRNMPKSPE